MTQDPKEMPVEEAAEAVTEDIETVVEADEQTVECAGDPESVEVEEFEEDQWQTGPIADEAAEEGEEQDAEPEAIGQEDSGVECSPHTETTEEEPTAETDIVDEDTARDDAEEPQRTEEPAEPAEEKQPITIESVVEAILFASDEPLTDNRLAKIVETTGKQVRHCIEALNEKYETNHNAFRIEQIAGGYQMLTLSTYNQWLGKMLRVRSDTKLSPAAMETLAIIAYKQPVIRVDIEAIRGVAVGEVIRSLMYKGLVKIVGRAEILGRPMLYGTTKKFLEVFGLNSLKDLPKAEELKKPD